MKEAQFYIKKNNNIVQCSLCHHNCIIKPEHIGICGVRKNIDGKLYGMTYGDFCSVALDPIEKKPLYHFYPGKEILSLGSIGCNYKCFFCQNYEISQEKCNGNISCKNYTAEDIIKICNKYDAEMVAFTYNEPLIMYEYLNDTLPILKKNNIETVLVTNGSISTEAVKKIAPFVSAANIDLKGFTESFYKENCSGNLEYVKEFIKCFFEHNVHIELTNLIITSLNDNISEITEMIYWISSLSNKIPLHFSRYFPKYKSNHKETDVNFMIDVYSYAVKKLKYVYLGNVGLNKYSSTFCPECNNEVISRNYYSAFNNISDSGLCPECGYKIDGIF